MTSFSLSISSHSRPFPKHSVSLLDLRPHPTSANHPSPPTPPEPPDPPDHQIYFLFDESIAQPPLSTCSFSILAPRITAECRIFSMVSIDPSDCVKVSSSPSLGFVSPDRKFSPVSSEASLLPFIAMTATSSILLLHQSPMMSSPPALVTSLSKSPVSASSVSIWSDLVSPGKTPSTPPTPPDPPDPPDHREPPPPSQIFARMLSSTRPGTSSTTRLPFSPAIWLVTDGSLLPFGSLSVVWLADREAPPFPTTSRTSTSPPLPLLQTTARTSNPSPIPLPQVCSVSPFDSPIMDWYRNSFELVALGFWISGLDIDYVTSSVTLGFYFVPLFGVLTALVRVLTAICRLWSVFFESEIYVIKFTISLWHLGKGSPIIDTLPENMVRLDCNRLDYSIMEPFIIHVFSGFDTGNIVMKMALFEAAWKASMGTGDMGWSLQSSDLKFHSQDSTHRLHGSSAFVAETLAILPSMFATQAVGITFLVCFSDCQDLIPLVNAGGQSNELQRVMFTFQAFCHLFSSISFCFVALSACAAVTLARATLFACTTSSFIGV